MPAFDIVSEVDMQEVDNAVNQASKEISNRFDFKGSKSTLEFDKEKKEIKILADDDMKLRSIHQVLGQKLIKRSVDLSCLEYGNEDEVSGGMIRQVAKLKQGLEKPDAKKIVKLIKDSKLKVQAQIQDEQAACERQGLPPRKPNMDLPATNPKTHLLAPRNSLSIGSLLLPTFCPCMRPEP